MGIQDLFVQTEVVVEIKASSTKMAFVHTLALVAACIVIVTCQDLQFGDGTVHAEFEVVCNDTYMVVIFNKTALDERTTSSIIRPFKIEFHGSSDAACMANSNSSDYIDSTAVSSSFASDIYVRAMYPDGCGMNEYQDNDYIIYNHTIKITYGSNPNNFIQREEYDYYNVMCLRNRTNTKMIGGDKFNVTLRTTGNDARNDTAVWNFNFKHTDMSDLAQTQYTLGEKIKFTLDFNTQISTVKQVVQRCWATSDGTSNSYNLIDNRCASDVGTVLTAPADKQAVFTTEAFRYIGVGTSEVYIECLVLVCQNTNIAGNCGACGARKKRALSDSDKSATELEIVKSPIFYIIEKEQPSSNQQSSSSALSGTTGVIVIVLLALLVFIAALAIIKKVFFQPAIVQIPNVSMKGIDNNGMA